MSRRKKKPARLRQWNSTLPAPTKRLIQRKREIGRANTAALIAAPKPRKRIRAVNPERKAETFARCYHSVERVEWVKAQPSVVSGKGPCENAHIEGDGASRKAHYAKIVPLTAHEHRVELHAGRAAFEAKYGIDLDVCAAETEARWIHACGGRAPSGDES